MQLDGFPVTTPLTIQWGNQDAFGHVNNIHYFQWMESGRIDYLFKLGIAITSEGVGPILAAINCNYRKQISFPDSIVVGTRITNVGRTSMTIEHQIWSEQNNAIAADGESTVVMFDYDRQKPCPISDDLRTAIEALEGSLL